MCLTICAGAVCCNRDPSYTSNASLNFPTAKRTFSGTRNDYNHFSDLLSPFDTFSSQFHFVRDGNALSLWRTLRRDLYVFPNGILVVVVVATCNKEWKFEVENMVRWDVFASGASNCFTIPRMRHIFDFIDDDSYQITRIVYTGLARNMLRWPGIWKITLIHSAVPNEWVDGEVRETLMCTHLNENCVLEMLFRSSCALREIKRWYTQHRRQSNRVHSALCGCDCGRHQFIIHKITRALLVVFTVHTANAFIDFVCCVDGWQKHVIFKFVSGADEHMK